MNCLLEASILDRNASLLQAVLSQYNPYHEKKHDAQIKWIGVLEAFTNLGIKPTTVIDVGSSMSSQVLYLKTIVPTVYSIDCGLTEQYSRHLTNAGIDVTVCKVEECTKFQPNSIDCIVDSCAVGCSMDLERVLEKISIWLKPGGYFISAGDSDLNQHTIPFASPDLWIKTAKKYGLELLTDFNHESKANAYNYPYDNYTLYIARFVFQKSTPTA
jgi:SAM-dependent methyltransferase